MLTGTNLKRLKIGGLRRMLRGCRILKQSHCIWKVNAVNEALTITECAKDRKYSETIFGAAAKNGELVVRQYLLMRLAGVRLGKTILYAHGKTGSAVVYPLPPEWRKVVERQGFEVATIRSTAWWNALVILYLVYGILSIGKKVFQGIKGIILPSHLALGRHVFFDGLSENNLPQPPQDGLSHDIISWYQQWPGRARKLDTICHTVKNTPRTTVHGVPLISLKSEMPSLNSLAILFRYCGWGMAACTIATFDFLRGRWWHALLLHEASETALVRMQRSDQLAQDYLFHNSSWIYRPLWTYAAEEKGSRIIFYFYSTNCEKFKQLGYGPLRTYYGYQAMTWPYYLVWDEYQADFVRRVACRNPRIDVVGPIRFSTSAVRMPALPTKTIAVFDVQPFRDAFYNTLAIDFDYYTPETANRFLSDIHEVLKGADCYLALKRKRDVGNLVHPVYRHFVEKLEALSHFIFIDPSIAATKVVGNCIAVISMPFTSTALLGRESGRPSIYYDPHGLLQKDDPAAHGIEILQGQEELRRWLAIILENQPVDDLVHV